MRVCTSVVHELCWPMVLVHAVGLGEFNNCDGQLAILEIGCSTGINFEFYPPGCKVICTDPNPHYPKYLDKSMSENDHLTYDRFVVASGEDMGSVPDVSVDVVCTLMLCSVNNIQQTLNETHRVLRRSCLFCFIPILLLLHNSQIFPLHKMKSFSDGVEDEWLGKEIYFDVSSRLTSPPHTTHLRPLLTLPLNVMEITGLCALYKRVFPLLAYNITFSYNAKMLKIKRELFRNVAKFANADGTLRLLEIGCGSGANFQFYPYGCTVICSDPNPHFDKYLRRSMEQNKHLTYGELVVVSGEDMGDVQDESVDVVVCTLVLCSVSDVRRVLQEVRRVLRTHLTNNSQEVKLS
ncbi:putative methyltransferase-like protein 7A [Scophthalmus maximus]|uniref:Putative methyltransferase-like protein 7A n=1 Tax=Scophthalmus maximus TaxID=52904 RepID=A0A2U9BG13_SCOMX|nr:putative methyltransferase-like protein 7A [Scophthalmus maximus]